MNNVLSIAKRELRSSFNSPIAYAVILGFLVFTSVWLYFVKGFFAAGQADLYEYFLAMPWVLAFLAPALTMRSWAEERRLGTYELLLTLPFTEGQLVLGKYLAACAVAAVAILLTLFVPVTASSLGYFDASVLAAQYLGILLVSASVIAVGQCISSYTKNQITAFLVSVLVLLFLVGVGLIGDFFNARGLLGSFLKWPSFLFHYRSFTRGVVDTRDLAYFASTSILSLYLAAWGMTRRKWS